MPEEGACQCDITKPPLACISRTTRSSLVPHWPQYSKAEENNRISESRPNSWTTENLESIKSNSFS